MTCSCNLRNIRDSRLSERTSIVSVGMGKREGLFGVTMRSELGPLSFHTIIGKEQVKKESFPLGQQDDGLIKYDYQFLRDKYFFVKSIYRSFFLRDPGDEMRGIHNPGN